MGGSTLDNGQSLGVGDTEVQSPNDAIQKHEKIPNNTHTTTQ